MKQIKYLLFILSIGLFVSGCEKDANGRMPDDIKDSNVGVLVIAETSDVLVDANDFGALNVDFDVDILFDEEGFNKIDIMVVYKGDYTKQYVLGSITSVPTTFSFSINDLVSAIDELNSTDDIQLGDNFNFFTSITLKDGSYIPGYLPTGASTSAPSIRNIAAVLKDGQSSFLLPVPCPFVPNDFVGTMKVLEVWVGGSYEDGQYTAEVSINSELSTENTVVYDVVGLFTGAAESLYQLSVNKKTYALTHYVDTTRPADEQEMVDGTDIFGWGAGRLWFEDFTDAQVETCQGYITFNVTPTLNDIGAWWADAIIYSIGPGAYPDVKKSTTSNSTGPVNEALLKALLIPR